MGEVKGNRPVVMSFLRKLRATAWRRAAVPLLASFALCGLAQEKENQKQNAETKLPEVARDKVICFALHTADKGVLKLSAFFYPLKEGEARQATLEVQRDGAWRQVAEAPIEEMGWMALFRVDKWDAGKDTPYRVKHAGGSVYEGVVRHDPVEKDEIVVAVLSCNGADVRSPREDVVASLRQQNPDLLFFAGDQSDDIDEHGAGWLQFGRQFGEICKDRPVVAIPDKDLGQISLWGEGGEISRQPDGEDGGYFRPVPYVNMVQRAQCSHLPDPADPTPVKNGITVYYTSLHVGGIDFAIIEDRKWKSGPVGLVPHSSGPLDKQAEALARALGSAKSVGQYLWDPNYDRESIDVPEAELLGARQLKFLRDWGRDWTGAAMKCVLSNAPFAGTSHVLAGPADRFVADFDWNGWPQSGRNAALREMRRAFAVHLCGDQHLGTVVQYGINTWGDAPYAFAAPAIANMYGRSWQPLEKPLRHNSSNPQPDTGDYHDGLGNKLTMRAYFNAVPENRMGTGHGIARFKKSTREITFELWKRGSDVTKDKPAKGWPVTIRQEDNYNRAPMAWLPTLKIVGAQDPVVQVVDEANGDLVYTLRISGAQFRPKVFRQGFYTIHVGEGEHLATMTNVESLALDAPEKTLEVIVP